MDASHAPDPYVTSIYNAGWFVRQYGPQPRTSFQRAERAKAIHRLGLVVREAFAKSDNFEALLIALFNCLNHKDEPPPF